MDLSTWVKARAEGWHEITTYHSQFGMVVVGSTGEWIGRVNVEGTFARISETFPSAQAAMGAVERTYKRELENRRLEYVGS